MDFDLAYRAAKRAAPAAWAALVSALQACAISTPYPRVDPDGGPVLVAFTQAHLDPTLRAEFDRQTQNVLRALPSQPGLLGYSARREVFGTQVWTVSIWRDPAALKAFLAGPTHRHAIDVAMPAIADMVSLRENMQRAQVPRNWGEALQRLEVGRVRHHWE